MRIIEELDNNVEVMTGNQAIAHGVKLARAEVIAVYPITPQTSIVEELAKIVNNGELAAKFINVESEHTAGCVITGAELTGARSFTATCSQGLSYMVEPLTFLHGYRLPVVIAVTSRTSGAPMGSGGVDYSDIMTVRDFGFIQFFVESNQEAIDTVIQAYRVAEDPRVLMPAMVDLDGFYLSFSSEQVSLPQQEKVDRYLPPYRSRHVILDPADPMTILETQERAGHIEKQNEEAMIGAREVILEADATFGQIFGRQYGGMVEKHRCEDAKVILVTMGSMTGTARVAVDELRNDGKSVGLLKIRVFRPFPVSELREMADKERVFVVIDRNVSHGASNSGILGGEIKAALYGLKENAPEVLNFVAGLGGVDISVQDFKDIAVQALAAAEAKEETTGVTWLLKTPLEVPPIFPKKADELNLFPGTNSCSGCLSQLALRHTLKAVGKDTVLLMPPGCMSVTNGGLGFPGYSPLKMAYFLTVFPGVASTAVGVREGLDIQGKEDTVVLVFAGDGATSDIGMQCLSGAATRGDSILYVCYDNEAYMNTGVQMSGTTPYGVETATTPVGKGGSGNKSKQKKGMVEIMAAHRVPYAATASVAYLEDYKKKLGKALRVVRERRGLAYLHIHCPCNVGWGYQERLGIEVARLAVQTRMWNLYEFEGDQFKLNLKTPKPRLVEEYLKVQGRFSNLSKEQTAVLQSLADAEYTRLSQKG